MLNSNIKCEDMPGIQTKMNIKTTKYVDNMLIICYFGFREQRAPDGRGKKPQTVMWGK